MSEDAQGQAAVHRQRYPAPPAPSPHTAGSADHRHRGAIRCTLTGRTLFIAPVSTIDHTNPGVAEQLSSSFQPPLHQTVTDHR